jgi:hypothetical protein
VRAAPEVFQHALHGPLAHSQTLPDLTARKTFRFQLQHRPPVFRQKVAEMDERFPSLGHFAWSIEVCGEIPGMAPIGPHRFLAVHIVLLAGSAAVLVYHFILRSPGQERDKMPRIFEVRRTAFDSLKEASPHTLKEIEGIEARAQEPRKLAAYYEAHLSLVARQEFPGSVLIPPLDARKEFSDAFGPNRIVCLARHVPVLL